MARQRFVKMEKEGVSGEVLPESVPAWERNGWTVVDDGDKKPEGHQEPSPNEVSDYDFGDEDEFDNERKAQ